MGIITLSKQLMVNLNLIQQNKHKIALSNYEIQHFIQNFTSFQKLQFSRFPRIQLLRVESVSTS